MNNQEIKILLNQIDKKLNNLEYRITGKQCRNKMQNITFDSNLDNLISIHNLLIDIKKVLLVNMLENTNKYTIFTKMFVNFGILRKNNLWKIKI